MRRPANILFLSILIGALSAAMIYRYLQTQRGALEEALRQAQQQQTGVQAVPITVAKETIPIGSEIRADQLKVVAWPVEAQPEGAITDPAQAVGSVARVTLNLNEPITRAHLVGDKTGLLALLITEGMRAMSVRVDKVSGVSGFITPNSHVDVVLAGSPSEKGENQAKIILQNVTVLATGTEVEVRDNKPVEVPTVTLLVSPEDAEKLTLATQAGPIQLALRNYRDEDTVTTRGVNNAGLFGVPPAPPSLPAPVRRGGGGERPSGFSVEILLGDKLSRQGLS